MGDAEDRRRVVSVPHVGAGPAIIATGIVVLVLGLAWLNNLGDTPTGGTTEPLVSGERAADEERDESIPASEPASPRSLLQFFDGTDEEPTATTVRAAAPTDPLAATGPTTAGGDVDGSGTPSPGSSTASTDRPRRTTTTDASSPVTADPPATSPPTEPPPTTSTSEPPPTTDTTVEPPPTTEPPTTTAPPASSDVLDGIGGLVDGVVDGLL